MADRPDLDALIADLDGLANLLSGLANRAIVRRAAAALAAERARADQAEQRIADAPHDQWCAMPPRWPDYKDVACTCWKSNGATAEQGATNG